MKTMSNVKRIKQHGFTITDNKLIKDERLSWKARGIFQYLWAMPDDWDFYVDEVVKHSTDGITALKSGLSELEKYGYLKRTRIHDDKGLFSEMSWELSDTGNFTISKETHRMDKTINGEKHPMKNVPLLNKNNTNKKETLNKNISSTGNSKNAFELYQIHVGMLSGKQTPIFVDYVQKLGDEVVQFAINLMLDQTSRPNFNYLQKILMKYESLKVTSVEKAKEIEEQFKNKRQSSSNYNKRPQFEEKMPSWMKSTESSAKSEDDNKNSQKDIKELMDKINKKTEKNKATKASE